MRVAVVVRPCLEALVAMALALAQKVVGGLCTTVASSCCPAHANRSRFSFYGTNSLPWAVCPRRVKPYAHACHAVLANPPWPRFIVVCMGIALTEFSLFHHTYPWLALTDDACAYVRFDQALVVAFCGARPRPSLEDTLHAAWPLVGFSVPYPGVCSPPLLPCTSGALPALFCIG
ncbi:hypothetical protein V6N12_036753 [Hibiscus sabdariffa]|uniref:Secreted protein n=1 Tax=Hibiscus sabdariffa TaxID=183260 RepID=A0ABR2B9U2_9ROSI